MCQQQCFVEGVVLCGCDLVVGGVKRGGESVVELCVVGEFVVQYDVDGLG